MMSQLLAFFWMNTYHSSHSKVSHCGMITKSFWLHGDQKQLEIPAELISFGCQVILLHR